MPDSARGEEIQPDKHMIWIYTYISSPLNSWGDLNKTKNERLLALSGGWTTDQVKEKKSNCSVMGFCSIVPFSVVASGVAGKVGFFQGKGDEIIWIFLIRSGDVYTIIQHSWIVEMNIYIFSWCKVVVVVIVIVVGCPFGFVRRPMSNYYYACIEMGYCNVDYVEDLS